MFHKGILIICKLQCPFWSADVVHGCSVFLNQLKHTVLIFFKSLHVFGGIQVIPYYYVLIYMHWIIYCLLSFPLSLQGINGILADEMGLGKTVQSIALLAHLAEVRAPGHRLSFIKKTLCGIFNCLCCFDLWENVTTSVFVHLHPLKRSLVSGFIEWPTYLISLLWTADLPAL